MRILLQIFLLKNFHYHSVIISVYREWGVLCFHPLTDRLTSKLSPNLPSLPLQWTWLCLLTLSLFVCFSFKWYLRNNITFRTMYCSFMWLPCFSWLLITEFYIFYSWKLEILWNCFPLKIPSWPLEQCTATSSSRVCLTSRQTWYLTIQKLLFAIFHFF